MGVQNSESGKLEAKGKSHTLFCPGSSKGGKQTEHQGEQGFVLHGEWSVVPGGVDAMLVGLERSRVMGMALLHTCALLPLNTLNVAQSTGRATWTDRAPRAPADIETAGPPRSFSLSPSSSCLSRGSLVKLLLPCVFSSAARYLTAAQHQPSPSPTHHGMPRRRAQRVSM